VVTCCERQRASSLLLALGNGVDASAPARLAIASPGLAERDKAVLPTHLPTSTRAFDRKQQRPTLEPLSSTTR
jgi:hypothetical protein